MYSYLYAIIGLSLFQILYPILLITVFKKKWFHIDDENGTLSKREVRNRMGKREYIFALPISLAIFIINIVLFVYFVCTSQVKITLAESEIFAVSLILLLILFAPLMSGLSVSYFKVRENILGRTIRFGKRDAPLPHEALLRIDLEKIKRQKWLIRESNKSDGMSAYYCLIFFNFFILIPILLLY